MLWQPGEGKGVAGGARLAAALGVARHLGRWHFLERRQRADLAALVVDLNVRKKQCPGHRAPLFHPTGLDQNAGCLSLTNGVLESGTLTPQRHPRSALLPIPNREHAPAALPLAGWGQCEHPGPGPRAASQLPPGLSQPQAGSPWVNRTSESTGTSW